MAQPKERTLYCVEYGNSTYYATGNGAFNALRRCVEHDDAEGNFGHTDEVDLASVTIDRVGTADIDMLAWSVA